MPEKVTYVSVPVRFDSAGQLIGVDLGDDGEAGLWGDTYIYEDEEAGTQDEWVHDHEAQIAALEHVEKVIALSEFLVLKSRSLVAP